MSDVRFYFHTIELAKLSANDLEKTGLIGLLPLTILTRDGATHEKAEEILTKLETSEKTDVLQAAYNLVTLVFKSDADQEWLIRRFRRMNETFRETKFYREITQSAREEGLEQGRQEGLEQGREQGRQEGRLQDSRQILISFIQARFPKLEILARAQANNITDPDTLHRIMMKLFTAQNLEEAVEYLSDGSESTKKHD